MRRKLPSRSIVFATAGLTLDGGISNLSNSMVDALESMVDEDLLDGAHVISLLDTEPPPASKSSGWRLAAGGRRSRFSGQMWLCSTRTRPSLILYDVAGIARVHRVLRASGVSAPYGLMVHDTNDLNPNRRPGMRQVLADAAFLMANSRTTARFAAAAIGEDANIHIVWPAVSRDRITVWTRQAEIPYLERPPSVLMVGRLDGSQRAKGHEHVLNAWPAIRDAVPEARLTIVGDGSDRQRLEEVALSTLGPEGVDFLGKVTNERLGQLYGRSRVFVMPSRQEGFGIVYAEAMWHGVPCIGSSADAGSETIAHNETGLIVPFGDTEAISTAIRLLLTNHKKAQAMSRMAWCHSRSEFVPEAYANRVKRALIPHLVQLGPDPMSSGNT